MRNAVFMRTAANARTDLPETVHSKVKKNHLAARCYVNGGLGEESAQLFLSFTAVPPHTQVNDRVHR